MATIKLVLDKRAQKKDNTYPIKILVTHKKNAFIGTGISVLETQWNGKEVIDHPEKARLNKIIGLKFYNADSILLNLDVSGELKNMDINDVVRKINHSDEPEKIIPVTPQKLLLIDFFDKYIARVEKTKTKVLYGETKKKIIKFDSTVTFKEVTVSWLKDFDAELAKNSAINTRSIHFRNIRAVFNDAINSDTIDQNLYPFRKNKFKIRREETRKRALTVDQLKTVRDYPVQEHQQKYRDIFMLSFYLVGINMVDLLNLKPSDYTNGRIEYRRSKTGRLYSIEVLPEAQKILKKYKGKKYLIDVLDKYKNHQDFTSRTNENLKEIGLLEWTQNNSRYPKFLKNNKKKITPLFPDLSFYWARHTWATIAAGLDIPKETIAAALGHSKKDVTDGYIDFDRSKIDKANKDVLAFVS